MYRVLRIIAAAALCIGLQSTAWAQQTGWVYERTAASFDRSQVAKKDVLQQVRRNSNLTGAVGWFEYDFTVPTAGWHEIVINGSGADVEFSVGNAMPKSIPDVPGSLGFDGKQDKIGNFWLAAGRNTLRMQRYFWTGFPQITGFTVRAANGSAGTSMRVQRPVAYGIYRKGACGTLDVHYGPAPAPVQLPVHWVNSRTSATLRSEVVTLRATKSPFVYKLPIPCDSEGHFVLYFNGGPDKIANRDIHHFSYEVIDTALRPVSGSTMRKTLVQTIDCAITPPDYNAGETRFVRKPFGAYRESGDRGWIPYQHARLKISEASWFAYTLQGIEAQRPYLVEIDYPDDTVRTFAIALRESAPLSYPVTGGVDSGGEFKLSNDMRTHTLLYWPRAADTRIVFLPAHDGQRAAAARIRVYRVDGELPGLTPAPGNGRAYANWYEEGSNFLSMYGAPDESPHGVGTALERWAQAVSYMGGSMLWPTVSIYSFALYPSSYNLHFSRPWGHDLLRQTLLTAEKHGLKVVPEVHPRADELGWPYDSAPDPKPNLLVSRDGDTRKDLPPFYNPLHRDNRAWYLDMVGEIAERYRDSPALAGISLRFMQWKNPSLFNFHSLDWGYDDLTVGMFERETGITIPVRADDSRRYAARYQWLMANAKEQWISWRCRKVAELVTQIRDRVRRHRSDLVIYIPVYPMTEAGSTYNAGTAWLREAGIDAQLLGRIEGVVLVNALHGYGRRFGERIDGLLRRNLTDTAAARAILPAGKPGSFLPYAVYFEATEAIVPPERLGFPSTTRKTWMSAVINPSGRNYLERFALQLADSDAVLLGDGGNTYTLGQPELREFLNEYRRLPAEPFRLRSPAEAPVVIRDLPKANEYLFYVVNRKASPVTVRITIEAAGTGSVEQLGNGEKLQIRGDTLILKLVAFQLLAFRAPAAMRIQYADAR